MVDDLHDFLLPQLLLSQCSIGMLRVVMLGLIYVVVALNKASHTTPLRG
jgi:hypothetical protein